MVTGEAIAAAIGCGASSLSKADREIELPSAHSCFANLAVVHTGFYLTKNDKEQFSEQFSLT